jgi:hypothetical protein
MSILRYRHLPVLLLLLCNLAAGVFVFQDFGMSWDEPLFYQYANSIGYAYSIEEWLGDDFDLENAYGPSGDHGTYGPAYLLIARPVVAGLQSFLAVRESDLWHLVNFLTFQVGVLFLYALALLFVRHWAAFAAAFLFSTQPVLWGVAWINPKDIPFMVFFLAAFYTGLRMVDQLAALSPVDGESHASLGTPGGSLKTRWTRVDGEKIAQFIKIGSAGLFVPALVLVAFSALLQNGVAIAIQNAYHAPSESLPGQLFSLIAPNAGQIGVDAYLNKGLVLFARFRMAVVILALSLLPLGYLAFFKPVLLKRGMVWSSEVLSPLPARPALWIRSRNTLAVLASILPAAIVFGLLVSIRVLGPLAGLLVVLYFFLRPERRSLADLGFYALAAMLVMYLTWPYLWEAPLARFFEVSRHMSNNPQILSVLFNGVEYPSNKLPVSYLPVLLAVTLTLAVWPMFAAGLAAAGIKIASKGLDWRKIVPLLLWFFIPFLYVVVTRPPMYDSYRHFLFILPPLFVVAGMGFQFIQERFNPLVANLLLLLLIAPGLFGIIRSHPYQYAYFNEAVGGTGGAFRRFETDYWLTCYREIIEQLNAGAQQPVTLFVHRQPPIALEYAGPHVEVLRYDLESDQTFPGSLLLLSSRTGVDQKYHPESPNVYSVERDGAIFCLIRQIE